MIFKAFRIASKVASIAWAAKTGYSVYKKGDAALKGLRKAKSVSSKANTIIKEVKKVLKK